MLPEEAVLCVVIEVEVQRVKVLEPAQGGGVQAELHV
jgi:hypothetical protein